MCRVAMKSELVTWRFICIFGIVWNSADCFSYRQFIHFTAAFFSGWVQVFQCLDVNTDLATHLHYLFSRPSELGWCSRNRKCLWSTSNGLHELERKIRITTHWCLEDWTNFWEDLFLRHCRVKSHFSTKSLSSQFRPLLPLLNCS